MCVSGSKGHITLVGKVEIRKVGLDQLKNISST